MSAHKKHLSHGAFFLALWALIATGLVGSPIFDGPRHGFSAAAAAMKNPSVTVASQTVLYVKRHATRDGASAADQKYQEARRANRRTRIFFVAALVYLPPLLVLVFGWVIAWVARGFRSA